jgi:hypothetical protein
VRRALTWLAGLAGVAALLRRRARRRAQAAAGAADADATPDPAVQLRRKLDETRAAEPEPGAEPSVSLDDRRARVHDRAQETIDHMRGTDDDPAG